MSPAAAVKNAATSAAEVSAWVKWVVGILITVLITVNGWVFSYSLGSERRMSNLETGQTALAAKLSEHMISADNEKKEIKNRQDRQDAAQAQVLISINGVAVDVARVRGYLERNKELK